MNPNSPQEVNKALWKGGPHSNLSPQANLVLWLGYFRLYIIWLRGTELNKFYKHLEHECPIQTPKAPHHS